jgi:hypothetical protein
MFYAITNIVESVRIWWPVLLVFNVTFNNVTGIKYYMVTSFIGA